MGLWQRWKEIAERTGIAPPLRRWDFGRPRVGVESPASPFPPPVPAPPILQSVWQNRKPVHYRNVFTRDGGSGPFTPATPYDNYIIVAKYGGDYAWVSDALENITDNEAGNTYCIHLMPGLYDEPPEMKEYVALVGLDRDVCIIQSSEYETLLAMASHSSLNEVQVRTTYSGGRAVLAHGEVDILVDSCIIQSIGTSAQRALELDDCTGIRILGSEVYAENTLNWVVRGILLQSFTGGMEAEIRNCKVEVKGMLLGTPSAAIYAISGDTIANVRVLASHVIADNEFGDDYGIVSAGPTHTCNVYVLETAIFHNSGIGGGTDLLVTLGSGRIYVGRSLYSTWSAPLGGKIIPLQGDRPRLVYKRQPTDFVLSAAGGVWENTNCSDQINIPCQSDIRVDLVGEFNSNTIRAQAIRFRIDRGGVAQEGQVGYIGQPTPANSRSPFAVTAVFSGVPAGLHTITVQTARNNPGDTVTIRTQVMATHSVPWP